MQNRSWFVLIILTCALIVGACESQTSPINGDEDEDPPETRGAITGTLVFPGNVGQSTHSTGPDSAGQEHEIEASSNLAGRNQDVQVVPGEIVVAFPNGVAAQTFDTLSVGAVTLTAQRSLAGQRLHLYTTEGIDQNKTLDLAEELTRQPHIEAAFPNWVLHALTEPNDEFFKFQWHYEAMNLPAAWDIEAGVDNRVTVAVGDTGIIGHPDLDANVLPGYDFIDFNDDPTDPGGQAGYHGAHVAGTIGAVTNNTQGIAGVNWGARLVPVRVLDGDGAGDFFGMMDGAHWAAGRSVPPVPDNPNPARVINLSLGGNIGQACPNQFDEAFAELTDDGIIIVVAAGNDNVNAKTFFPANCDHVITVGSTGPTNDRAPYSNYGSVIDVMTPGGDNSRSFTIDGNTFVAGVLSTVLDEDQEPIYAFYQGTSMAAPHVAGLVSLMLAQDDTLTFETILARLKDASVALSASECGRPSGEDCGAGLVDARAALLSETGTIPDPLPEPEEVPTVVAAFYCVAGPESACDQLDTSRSRQITVETASNEVPFEIDKLEPGTYLAAAWQDLNQTGEVDEGEPFGVHPNTLTISSGETLTDVTIFLEPFSSQEIRDTSLPDLRRTLREAMNR